ncbi:ABC transporter ATP-binding protein [Streptomyces maremycinicus]|uniref:ABC transporter ATP-binding protein n=1 Tax=Streptomyces maremycinicus TaxID=1679753 RepID=UPI000787ADEE|nr:ABC transporter ATP-binding protein [Streptomyces sp. NBRC 110468]
MIRFENVSVTYDGAAGPTVRDVDLTVPEGELVLLAGPSGVGKSTLLGTVSGLVPHFTGGTLRGRVTVAGRDTRTHKPRELADVVGTVGQDPLSHFVTDTVEEELAYGMESLGLPPAVMRRRVEETLDLLGLAALRDRPIATLSGGQQQRVAIGSVLTPHPRVLVLDEPTSALDPAAAEEVLAVLLRLVHDLGTTVLLAEHRLERVLQYADQVALLPSPGAAPLLGAPADIMAVSPVFPPVVSLGRLAGWSPLPLTVRDARRRAADLRERLTEADHADSGDRADHTGPGDRADHADHADRADHTGPTDRRDRTDHTNPADRADPETSVDPEDPADPADHANPKDPADRADDVDRSLPPAPAPPRPRFSPFRRRPRPSAPSAPSALTTAVAPVATAAPTTPVAAVEARALSVRRARVQALREVDLTVRAGETVALMGRNGAGKSTLLNTFVGLVEPSAGTVRVGGLVPHRTPPRELVRRAGLVPQEPRDLLYADTVAAECAAADRDAGAAPGTCRALVSDLLPGITDDTHPRDLSEGQRLTLALAVVLTARPPLLLLDEPTRGLDYAAKARLVAVLRGLAAAGHAIVLATHDVELAAELAHRVVLLAEGEVIADGPTAEVVVSSPSFAPQVTKILAPQKWLTVAQVREALRREALR